MMDFPCRGEHAIVRRRVYARGSAAGRKRRTAAAHATVTRVHVVHGTAATAGVIVLPIAAGGYVSCARSEVPQDVAIVGDVCRDRRPGRGVRRVVAGATRVAL